MKLSNDWFSPRERVSFTSISTMFGYTGYLVSFLFPNLWVDPHEKDIAIAKNQIFNSLYY